MEWLQVIALLVVVLALAQPLGTFIYQVLDPQEKTFLDPVFKRLEGGIYRICGIDPLQEQNWKEYLFALLGFSFVSLLFTALFMAVQSYLPLNPQKFPDPSWHLNLNTAVSFMTNTNWQSYGGESTMSYLSQMASLAVQNFISAAVGLAVAAVLVRGIARKGAETVGNFWADLVRINLYLLLPISIVGAILLIWQGVPQNFNDYVIAQTLDGGTQTIAQGPIASQEAIKLIGTNGGGFTNVNSSHPYENPTPFANFFQMFLMFLIPAGQICYYGKSIQNMKHAWCIIAALAAVFLAGAFVCTSCEAVGNPELSDLNLIGGNWEGKETRFGVFGSALYACVTTIISCGAANCMHDSFSPIGGLIPMLNMQLSEVIFGGVGAGLYSVLLYVLLAVFISGLMIGRTPEYLGKKIESWDMKMLVFGVLSYVIVVHVFTSITCFTDWGIAGLGNSGPHGFSEILYAVSSCAANNGSAFAGLSANTLGYNVSLAAVMLMGRFFVIVPIMALAGSLAQKKIHPISFPVSSPVFISLLISIILLLGALTFLPALSMGPIVEQFFMIRRTLFP